MEDKLNRFLEYVPNGSKILDVGSGTGRDVTYFMDQGHSSFGIDFSEEMIAYAKENAKGSFCLMNMDNLKFNDSYFGGIWASSSIFTHLMYDDIKKSLAEVNRILMPNGVIGIIAMKKETTDLPKKDFIFNKFTKTEIISFLHDAYFSPFYIELFFAHDREWYFIISKRTIK